MFQIPRSRFACFRSVWSGQSSPARPSHIALNVIHAKGGEEEQEKGEEERVRAEDGQSRLERKSSSAQEGSGEEVPGNGRRDTNGAQMGSQVEPGEGHEKQVLRAPAKQKSTRQAGWFRAQSGKEGEAKKQMDHRPSSAFRECRICLGSDEQVRRGGEVWRRWLPGHKFVPQETAVLLGMTSLEHKFWTTKSFPTVSPEMCQGGTLCLCVGRTRVRACACACVRVIVCMHASTLKHLCTL